VSPHLFAPLLRCEQVAAVRRKLCAGLLPYCLIALLPYCLIALLPYCLISLLAYRLIDVNQGATPVLIDRSPGKGSI